MRKTLAALCLALLAACSATAGSEPTPTPTPTPTPSATTPSVPATFTLGIVFDLKQYTGAGSAYCSGRDGYDDIREGAQVKVTDSSGKLVALGALDAGLPQDGDYSMTCRFTATVKDVPRGTGLLGVEVSHRGVVNFKANSGDHTIVTLTLG